MVRAKLPSLSLFLPSFSLGDAIRFLFSPFSLVFFLMAGLHPFSIIQWNARGISNKSHWLKFQPFCSADIFVFQEIFLKPDQSEYILSDATQIEKSVRQADELVVPDLRRRK